MPFAPEVEGWTTHHGMHADLTDEVEWVLNQADLADAVDGFVFGIRRDMSRLLTGMRLYGDVLPVRASNPCCMCPVSACTGLASSNDEVAETRRTCPCGRGDPAGAGKSGSRLLLSIILSNWIAATAVAGAW